MAGKGRYILRSFSPDNYTNKKVKSNLFNLSNLGLNWDRQLIKSSLGIGTTESNKEDYNMRYNGMSDDYFDSLIAKTRDITRINNDYIAFFDRDYVDRRRFLRDFSQNGEIENVLDKIADEAIIPDDNNEFAKLDLKNLQTHLKKTKESQIILDGLTESYNRVYQMYGWNDSDDGWVYLKKFLVDGFLSFEILFDYERDENGQILVDDKGMMKAKDIIGFKELDPVTLEPAIVKDESTGQDIKIWYQYKDDPAKERIIPDSNIIYISWLTGNYEGRISYLEGLTRTFNMLRQLENSRIIWNVQNAQKRIKIVVPIGTSTPDRVRNRLNELKAYYNEDIQIDDLSGEVTIDGQPNFSFMNTYVFPSQDGAQTEVQELGVEGYDLNSIETLKYMWRRFIMETHIPPSRYQLDPTTAQNTPMTGEADITHEEYEFSRFIKRIRSKFKEILMKPVWIQFCLKFPLFAHAYQIKSLIGLKFNEENEFELAKARQIVSSGVNTVNSLIGIKKADGSPYFAVEFLVKKYLGMNDADLKLNEEYKLKEAKDAIDAQVEAKNAAPATPANGMPIGADSGMIPGGEGMDMGMSPDMSGGEGMDMGMNPDMSGGEDTMSGATPSAPSEGGEGMM